MGLSICMTWHYSSEKSELQNFRIRGGLFTHEPYIMSEDLVDLGESSAAHSSSKSKSHNEQNQK